MFLANPLFLLLLIAPLVILILRKRLKRPAVKHSNLKVARPELFERFHFFILTVKFLRVTLVPSIIESSPI